MFIGYSTNKKREYKNSKFGFGGQKKRSKSNTAQSSSDMSGVNRKASFSKPGKGRKLLVSNIIIHSVWSLISIEVDKMQKIHT